MRSKIGQDKARPKAITALAFRKGESLRIQVRIE
jgi:hypothetical protein